MQNPGGLLTNNNLQHSLEVNNFIRVVLNIFRKKKIKYLGLTGLIFSFNGVKYFVGSELLSSEDFDIEVYKDEVFRIENNTKILLNKEKALYVFDEVIKELIKTGMRVYIKP
ncbi:MAG: hypothetical protein ACOVP7_09675 [Lacibacter sp.]